MLNGPCDVGVTGPFGSVWLTNLSGAQAAAVMQRNADKRLRLRVRWWEATAADDEALRPYQVGLIKAGKGLAPW
jgi:hypothetical protein